MHADAAPHLSSSLCPSFCSDDFALPYHIRSMLYQYGTSRGATFARCPKFCHAGAGMVFLSSNFRLIVLLFLGKISRSSVPAVLRFYFYHILFLSPAEPPNATRRLRDVGSGSLDQMRSISSSACSISLHSAVLSAASSSSASSSELPLLFRQVR